MAAPSLQSLRGCSHAYKGWRFLCKAMGKASSRFVSGLQCLPCSDCEVLRNLLKPKSHSKSILQMPQRHTAAFHLSTLQQVCFFSLCLLATGISFVGTFLGNPIAVILCSTSHRHSFELCKDKSFVCRSPMVKQNGASLGPWLEVNCLPGKFWSSGTAL